MADLSAFPITKRWPVSNPDIIQVFGWPTPNGLKIPIALEEMGLDYETHIVTLADADVKSPEFLSLNPNNKIPAIIDPNGPDGEPLGLWESGAILQYLSEKTGKLSGTTARERHIVNQWLMFQMAGVGPMFGQLGFFYAFAGSSMEDPTARDRYINETKRLLGVMDKQLADRDWIAGDFSIADVAICPWLNTLDFYKAKEILGWDDFKNVAAYSARFNERPSLAKAMERLPRE